MIDGHTKIFGVIGYPVGHSLSPAMHNAAFKKLGINAAYLPFEVEPKYLGKAIEGLKALGIGGVNVTIPHKETVIKYIDNLSHEARLMGAVNAIVNKKGRLSGYNTDVFGFLKSLREDLRFQAKGRTIFVIGAGGASKAVCFGLAIEGAKRIILTDAADEKALALACEVELKTGCECIALRINSRGIPDMILNSQLLVNATPCGMKENDASPVNTAYLHEHLSVFDLVYNRKTKLIKIAGQKGLKASSGLNMLLFQGAKAFELWTGRRAPVEVMRKTLGK